MLLSCLLALWPACLPSYRGCPIGKVVTSGVNHFLFLLQLFFGQESLWGEPPPCPSPSTVMRSTARSQPSPATARGGRGRPVAAGGEPNPRVGQRQAKSAQPPTPTQKQGNEEDEHSTEKSSVDRPNSPIRSSKPVRNQGTSTSPRKRKHKHVGTETQRKVPRSSPTVTTAIKSKATTNDAAASSTDDSGSQQPKKKQVVRTRQKSRRSSEQAQTNWATQFQQLVKFMEQEGHTRVPKRHPDRSLASWVSTQRQAYKAEQDRRKGRSPRCNRRISCEQIAKLENLGFDWDASEKHSSKKAKLAWNARFEVLQQFIAENGHARVPQGYAPDPSLGTWVKCQRNAYQAEKMRQHGKRPYCTSRILPEQVKKLEAVGFEWDASDQRASMRAQTRWNEKFGRLLQFVDQHGHAQVPEGFAEDPSLANWVRRQRSAYKAEEVRQKGQKPRCAGRISEDQVQKLESVGFKWDATKVRKSTTKSKKKAAKKDASRRRGEPTTKKTHRQKAGKEATTPRR